MADPQLSQSTSIAKATAIDDRLSALVPGLATEYSPLKVYLPSSTPQLSASQQDGRALPDGTERYVWVAPDVNGDGSDYEVEVECIGAGGGGGGSANELGSGVNKIGSSATGTAATTATMTSSAATTDGSALIAVVAAGNSTAQTVSLTDSAGNVYTQIASGSNASSVQVWVFASFNAKAVAVGSTATFTTSNSEIVDAAWLWAPAIIGSSNIAPVSTGSTAAASSFTFTGGWNAGDAVVTVAFNNSAVNWNSSLTNPVSPYWAIDGVNSQASGNGRLSVFFGNPPSAYSGSPDNPVVGAASSVTGAIGLVIPFLYAHNPETGSPGGGGGGGEYAAELAYPVVPGHSYTYQIGNQGNGGLGSTDGTDGGDTIFDINGFGIEGGVVAHGGGAGQHGGNPGAGGTGSANTIHCDGGTGGSSSSGVGSDQPALYTSAIASDPYTFQFTLDESIGSLSAQDKGHNKRQTVRHVHTNAWAQPTTSGDTSEGTRFLTSTAAPAQVPPSKLANTTAGDTWRWYRNGGGETGGIEITGIPHATITTFTMSAWIKGGSEAAGPTDWGDSFAIICGNSDVNSSTNGFYMAMHDGSLEARATAASSGLYTIAVSPNLVSATDGNWHLVQADFNSGTIRLWIDGVLATTASGANTDTSTAGDFNMTIGYDFANGGRGFAGQMSNVWFTKTYFLTSSIVSQMYGSTAASGGGGGGASAGSGGAGNPGGNSTGATGGAAGLGNSSITLPGTLFSNAGRAGGNAGSNGALGGNFGGGGGGSGKAAANLSSNSTVYSLSVPATQSATYTGIDSTASGGSLYSASQNLWSDGGTTPVQTISTPLCITGGKPELPSNGTMASIVQFSAASSRPAFDGTALGAMRGPANYRWVIDQTYLTLTIKTTNASMIAIAPALEAMPPELTDAELSSSAWSGLTPALYYIPAGDADRQVTLSLPAYVNPVALLPGTPTFTVSTFRGSTVDDMGIGGYNDSENADFYCEFYGAGTDDGAKDAVLTFTYHYNSGSTVVPAAGSSGNPGQIRVTYLNPEGTPVTTILPAASTDVGGNQLAAGITTTRVRTWQPNSSPLLLEDWHGPVTLQGVWTGSLYYRITPDGDLQISSRGTNISASGTPAVSGAVHPWFVLPTGWIPAKTHNVPQSGSSITGFYVAGLDGNLGSNPVGTIGPHSGLVSGNYVTCDLRVPMD